MITIKDLLPYKKKIIIGFVLLGVAITSYLNQFFFNLTYGGWFMLSTVEYFKTTQSSKKWGLMGIPILSMLVVPMYFLSSNTIMPWIIFVAGSDSIQMIVGRKYGKTKVTKISPNKSFEGYLAGFIYSIMCGVVNALSGHYFYAGDGVIFSIIFLLGAVGDLMVSYIKRDMGVKDFTSALGEHGGFFDRIDAYVLPLILISLMSLL